MPPPLEEVVEAMRRLAVAYDLSAFGNQIHYEGDPEMAFYESWLHEAGHAIDLGRGRLHPSVNVGVEIDDLDDRRADRNEARAVSVEIVAARRFGFPLREAELVHAARGNLRDERSLAVFDRWVVDQVTKSPTTARYAARLHRLVLQEIEQNP